MLNPDGPESDVLSQFFQIHSETPQARLVRQAADIVRGGGVVVYPTDSAYALGCHIGDKTALDRNSADQKTGRQAQLYAGVPRLVRNCHLREGEQCGVPAIASNHARALYVYIKGYVGGAPASHAPQAQDCRNSCAEKCDSGGAAGRPR